MTTCASCSNDAVYTYQPGPALNIHYCSYHLPNFLRRTENPPVILYKEEEVFYVEEVKVPEVKTSKKKDSEAVAEESE